jgi:ferredoxin
MTLVQLEFIEGNCVHCKACTHTCPTGVTPYEEFDSRECILCLKCLDSCRFRALSFGLRHKPPHLPRESHPAAAPAKKT